MKMKSLLSAFLIVAIGAMVLMAADNTKRPHWYSDRGYTLSDMLIFGIDSSTVSGYQLKRRVITVPVTLQSAAADTVKNPLLVVPSGQTITVTEAILTASVEVVNAAGDSSFGGILYYHDDKTLDTCVAQFNDEANTIAYDDTIFTMTIIDSIFTAGEILYFWQMNHRLAATAAEGAAVTLKYRLDE